MKRYHINEIYRSVQGEGMRCGEDSLFVRFTGCNMRCKIEPGPLSPGGFDCDTEFESGRPLQLNDLIAWINEESQQCRAQWQTKCEWIVLTGGEPALQVDKHLIDALHSEGYKLQIETNGSVQVAGGIDFVTVSPKVAEHAIRQLTATEVKYVRGYGQALPKTRVVADHYLISPAFNGLEIDERSLKWCKELIQGTKWQLSIQQHKLNGQR